MVKVKVILMIKSISKDKISKEYRYVLKTSELEHVFEKYEIDIHVDLNYGLPQGIDHIFEAFFWLPNERVHYNRLYIKVGAVLNTDFLELREEMDTLVLPEFILWIKGILNLPEDSTQLKHGLHFTAVFKDGSIKFTQYI